jgi:hypothetical protein
MSSGCSGMSVTEPEPSRSKVSFKMRMVNVGGRFVAFPVGW